MKKVTVYTKVCLPCVDKKLWNDFQREVWKAGLDIKTVRTTYSAEAHADAVDLWGGNDYTAFVIVPNGDALNLKEATEMFKDINERIERLDAIRDKRVKSGKAKPVRKGKKNVQRLRQTERPIGLDSVEDSLVEIKVETDPQ